MTVINSDMISEKVTRRDVLPLSFLEESPYTGSKKGLRYKMEKRIIEDGENKETACLRLYTWHGRFSFDNTDESEIDTIDFEFSDKGIDNAIDRLNSILEER